MFVCVRKGMDWILYMITVIWSRYFFSRKKKSNTCGYELDPSFYGNHMFMCEEGKENHIMVYI